MKENLLSFKDQLESLSISEEKKAELLNSLELLNKDYGRMSFLHKQNVRDKAITINLLQNTVNELQAQKEYIAQANVQLTLQKQQLEKQSEELARSLQALEMSYHELEQFAFIASHDLKSPLRNIGSYAQLLKKRYFNQLNDDADTFLEFIVKNTQMMESIIKHLLEYSTIDRKGEFSLVDLNRIMELIRFNLRESIDKNNVTIEFDELPQLWMQKSGITQVVQHLIENAIKFRSSKLPHIRIEVAENEKEKLWHFSIKDNGLGLNEKYKDKAFHPFQRIDSRNLPGEGMGLAICWKIIKLHGGDIWYKENTEGGTTFHFTIPKMKLESIPQSVDTLV
jgi:light-regulated signal transduction histidine kinase (bacteriophytochrome)